MLHQDVLPARKTEYQHLLCEWRLDGILEREIKRILFDAASRDFVLSSLSLSLLAVIHVFTPEMLSCI